MKKLVAESVNEYVNLNEEHELNESILSQYSKLNKKDPNALKEFALKLATKKYVSGAVWDKDAAYKLINQIVQKLDSPTLLSFLEKAAADNFAGRAILVYADPATKTGRSLSWKNVADLNLKAEKTP